MIVGLVFTMTYIVMCTADRVLPFWFEAPFLTQEQWLWGISPQGIGVVGMALNFVIALVLSFATRTPPIEIQDLVEHVRVPESS